MNDERLEATDKNMNRIQQLQEALSQLTQNVVITEVDEERKTIQALQLARLEEDIAVLLICADPNREIHSLWDLIEPHLPEAIRREQTQHDKYRDLFSQPLAGQPSGVLARTGFSNQTNPMFIMLNNLRKTMTPEQQQMLPQVTGRMI